MKNFFHHTNVVTNSLRSPILKEKLVVDRSIALCAGSLNTVDRTKNVTRLIKHRPIVNRLLTLTECGTEPHFQFHFTLPHSVSVTFKQAGYIGLHPARQDMMLHC